MYAYIHTKGWVKKSNNIFSSIFFFPIMIIQHNKSRTNKKIIIMMVIISWIHVWIKISLLICLQVFIRILNNHYIQQTRQWNEGVILTRSLIKHANLAELIFKKVLHIDVWEYFIHKFIEPSTVYYLHVLLISMRIIKQKGQSEPQTLSHFFEFRIWIATAQIQTSARRELGRYLIIITKVDEEMMWDKVVKFSPIVWLYFLFRWL